MSATDDLIDAASVPASRTDRLLLEASAPPCTVCGDPETEHPPGGPCAAGGCMEYRQAGDTVLALALRLTGSDDAAFWRQRLTACHVPADAPFARWETQGQRVVLGQSVQVAP